jgi:hypothetical protein
MPEIESVVRLFPSDSDEDVFLALFGPAPSRALSGMALHFSSGGRRCELSLLRVREVIAGARLVPLPGGASSEGWMGAIVIRGEALAVRRVPGSAETDFGCFLRIAGPERDYVIGADRLPVVAAEVGETASLESWVEGGG